MNLKKRVLCPECGRELKLWEEGIRPYEEYQIQEMFVCQNPHCDVVKVLVERKEDLK